MFMIISALIAEFKHSTDRLESGCLESHDIMNVDDEMVTHAPLILRQNVAAKSEVIYLQEVGQEAIYRSLNWLYPIYQH